MLVRLGQSTKKVILFTKKMCLELENSGICNSTKYIMDNLHNYLKDCLGRIKFDSLLKICLKSCVFCDPKSVRGVQHRPVSICLAYLWSLG